MPKRPISETEENLPDTPALTQEYLVLMHDNLRDLTQTPNGWPRLTLAERFAKRVVLADPSECWEWNGLHDRLGYARINGKVKSTYAHRTAYELMVGPIPEGMELDHICRNRGCVNPFHLRACTHSQNLMNLVAKSGSKSGLKGVSWHRAQQKWCARIMVNGKSVSLGYFKDPNEAHAAYRKASKELHGDFSNAG